MTTFDQLKSEFLNNLGSFSPFKDYAEAKEKERLEKRRIAIETVERIRGDVAAKLPKIEDAVSREAAKVEAAKSALKTAEEKLSGALNEKRGLIASVDYEVGLQRKILRDTQRPEVMELCYWLDDQAREAGSKIFSVQREGVPNLLTEQRIPHAFTNYDSVMAVVDYCRSWRNRLLSDEDQLSRLDLSDKDISEIKKGIPAIDYGERKELAPIEIRDTPLPIQQRKDTWARPARY